MENITIHNYEAFYLDYLEGNLDEKEQVMLELFLAEHPECKVDFDEITTLPIKKEAELSDFDKYLLKQLDFNLLEINYSTINVLLIAKTENLLNSEKIKEVDAFLASNSNLQKTEREFLATQLKADLGIVFEDKNLLKKERKIIPMWSIVASIAAVLILYFTLNFEGKSDSNQLVASKTFSNNQINKEIKNESKNHSVNVQQTEQSTKNIIASVKKSDFIAVTTQKVNNHNSYDVSNNYKNEDIQLNLKKVKVPNSIDVYDLEIEKHNEIKTIQKSTTSKSIVTMYGMEEMENPIQPITKQLSQLTKKEVDFKISKPKTKGRKSFYLKIGKLEISRKRH